MTIAFTLSSLCAAAIASTRPWRTGVESAFTGGLLERIMSTSPCLRVEIGLVVGLSMRSSIAGLQPRALGRGRVADKAGGSTSASTRLIASFMTIEPDAFRNRTRAWLEANCPAEMRTPVRSEKDICWGGRNFTFQSDAQRRWLETMAELGWTVPDWPKVYGGGGISTEQARILKEEMQRIGARAPLTSFGISMLGPALLKFGSEEQKKRFLPEIARAEIRWCEGYSEPAAGSDLAALKTKAEDKGDHWLVNGQKVWTSYADKADWIVCLVRTSTDSKQGGISFLLFDMNTKGVSTRPILLISGYSPFCETLFDDVEAPKEQIVGDVNKGWDVAKYLLGHEREMIAGMGLGTGGSSLTLRPLFN